MPPGSDYRARVSTAAPRDVHRQAVYDAEAQVERLLASAGDGRAQVDFFGSTLVVPVERRFGDLAGVQRYVDAVLALDWVTARWPALPPIAVRHRRGAARAVYEPATATIAVPAHTTWAMRETVAIHEIAHHLDRMTPKPQGAESAHGPTWAAIHLGLLGVAIGPEVTLLLRAGFDGAGVPVGAVPEPKTTDRRP